jgi:hypothetical protein
MTPPSDQTTNLHALIRRLAEALPAGSVVPVPREWLLEVLQSQQNTLPNATVDLSPADLAREFGRSPTTIRGWIERGEFPGA